MLLFRPQEQFSSPPIREKHLTRQSDDDESLLGWNFFGDVLAEARQGIHESLFIHNSKESYITSDTGLFNGQRMEATISGQAKESEVLDLVKGLEKAPGIW